MVRLDVWEFAEMRELALRVKGRGEDEVGYDAPWLAEYLLRLIDYIEELERER